MPSLPISICLQGPEFGMEKDCIFVGMVTEDVDISELLYTICALGRDIEESGRVTAIFNLLLPEGPLTVNRNKFL